MCSAALSFKKGLRLLLVVFERLAVFRCPELQKGIKTPEPSPEPSSRSCSAALSFKKGLRRHVQFFGLVLAGSAALSLINGCLRRSCRMRKLPK